MKAHPSALTLGTAQLGSDYGIANRVGRQSRKNSLNIIKTAFNNGIHSFDTAWGYGESESILGSFIASQKYGPNDPLIISKVPKIKNIKGRDFEPVYKSIKQYAADSLKRLKKPKIEIYLLHDASDMTSCGGNVLKSLLKLKSDGMIGMAGVSVYYPRELKRALLIKDIEAVQMPVNIFDHRFITADILSNIRKSGKLIFARSVFLQGLFFLDPAELPVNLGFARRYLSRLQDFLNKENIGINELAMCFVKSIPEIASIITGAESESQILNNVNVFKKCGITKRLKNRVLKTFGDIPDKVRVPSRWFQREKGSA